MEITELFSPEILEEARINIAAGNKISLTSEHRIQIISFAGNGRIKLLPEENSRSRNRTRGSRSKSHQPGTVAELPRIKKTATGCECSF